MVIALITISGGMMPEGKLDRALRRMNADNSTPLGTKEKTLKLIVDNGYVARIKETQAGGEETVDYIVGPRGKLEVGRAGVADLVRMMYGQGGEEVEEEELEKRIERTLNIAEAFNGSGMAVESAGAASQTAGRKRTRRNEDDD
jgi:hypothetical protein